MNILAFKLINRNAFKLRFNTKLPNFYLIRELFKYYGIPIETWTPGTSMQMNLVEMSFTSKCNFQDVYLLATILKEFGLHSIYPSNKINNEISIGTYVHQIPSPENFYLGEPISIESFLAIDPKLTTQHVIDNYFKKDYLLDETEINAVLIKDFEEAAQQQLEDSLDEDQGQDKDNDDYDDGYDDYDEGYDDYDTYDDYDWERENFDAMTDGQLGDYDDFHGNIDDVMTWAGRD